MDGRTVSIKTGSFVGIFVMSACMIGGTFLILIMFFTSNFNWPGFIIFLILFFVLTAILGIYLIIPNIFTVNQHGIILVKGNKLKQNRSWNEINKIATYIERSGGEVDVVYRVLRIFFHDGKPPVLR
jgi:hypothetical protein